MDPTNPVLSAQAYVIHPIWQVARVATFSYLHSAMDAPRSR